MYAHLSAARPKVTDRRPDLPGDIDRVVTRALAKGPEDRFDSAGELVDAAGQAFRVARVVPTPPRPARSLPSRGGRRRWLIAGTVAAALLVATVGALLLGGRGDGGKGLTPRASALSGLQTYLARVSPTGKVTRIRLGSRHPRAVVVAEGSVWVVNNGDDTVSRIDPVTGKSVTIRVGKDALSIAAGEGAIWVANELDRSVSRIDPGTNAVTRIPLDSAPIGIAVGEGAVWAAGYDAIFKIDRTSRVVGSYHLAPRDPAGRLYDRFSIAAGEGSVWLGLVDGTLLQLNPQSLHVRRSISLGVSSTGVAIGGGSVWVAASATPGILLQIDPLTGKPLAEPIRAGAGRTVYPIREAVDGNHVWVTDSLNGAISRFGMGTGQLSLPIDVGKYPTAIAVGLGSVWVTVDSRPKEGV
jgi:streptogramin lyase